MATPTRILGICEKHHLKLLKAATTYVPHGVELEQLDISDIPMYDAGADTHGVPKVVETLIQKINDADSVVFALSGVNHALTSSFQSTLNWVASSRVLDSKPAAIFGMGNLNDQHKAQVLFRAVAASLNLYLLARPELVIDDSALDSLSGEIVNESTKDQLRAFFTKFQDWTVTLKSPTPKPRNIRVYALSGSLRKASANTGLLRSAKEIAPTHMDIEIADLSRIPMYNGDVENAGIPPAVQVLLDKIQSADALLFASTEYNYGISAPLKNAIDWASRKNAFAEKPAMVISSGGLLGGAYSQYHLRQSLIYPGGYVAPGPQLCVQTYGGAIDLSTGNVVDESVKSKIKHALDGLYHWTLKVNHSSAVPVDSHITDIPEVTLEPVDKVSPTWTNGKLKVLAIPGSLRTASFNKGLTRVSQECAPDTMEIQVADISKIPFFNNDVEDQGVPQAAQNFVDHIISADALLFVAPEYNYTYSGPLKNAIDWASRQKAFFGKPAAVVGAGGLLGASHSHTLLRNIGVEIHAQFLVKPTFNRNAFIPGQFDFSTGSALDESIKQDISQVLQSLADFTNRLSTSPSAKPIKIAVVPGSANSTTLTGGFLRAFSNSTPPDTTIEVVDPFDLPRYFGDTKEIPEQIKPFTNQLESADAVIFIVPEYNNTLSPIIKNAMDWAIRAKALDGKAVSSVGYGDHHHGNYALFHVRQVAAAGYALFYDDHRVQVNAADHQSFNADTGDIVSEELLLRIADQLVGLRDWALRFS